MGGSSNAVHGSVVPLPRARLIAKTWSWETHLAHGGLIGSWIKERKKSQDESADRPGDPLAASCFAARGLGILQWGALFLLPADLPLPGDDGLGWPRLCRRALACSCPAAGRDGRRPRCPTAFHARATWKSKPALIACPYGRDPGADCTPSQELQALNGSQLFVYKKRKPLSKHRRISSGEGWWPQTPECTAHPVEEERGSSQPCG